MTVFNRNDDETSAVRRVPSLAPVQPDPGLPRHVETRRSILAHAQAHTETALADLTEALAWFAIIDPQDRSELLRRVQGLRDTIDYRASL